MLGTNAGQGPGSGGDGEQGGVGGSHAEGGAAGGERCPLVTGDLDVDIPVVSVSGTVTVNGAPPRRDMTSVIQLVQRQPDELNDEFNIATVADGHYSADIVPGKYDVVHVFGGIKFPVLEQVTLGDVPTFDIDVRTASISGSITLNGAQVAAPNDATIGFQAPPGFSAAWTLVHDGAYSFELPFGSYDVTYGGGAIETDGAPNNWGATIVRGVTIDGDKTLDIDIPMVTLSGTITGAGQLFPFPTDSVYLEDSDGGRAWLIGDIGPDFTAEIVPGTYSIFYDSKSDPQFSTVPGNHQARIRDNVIVDESGTLDIDVPMVTISGSVTLNGNLVPTTSNAALLLVSEQGGSIPVATFQSPTYSARVVPGTYDLVYRAPDSESVAAAADDGLPDNSNAIARRGIVIDGTSPVDLDVPMVVITGDATLNGSPLPKGSRGHYYFQNWSSGDFVLAATPSSSATAYTAEIVPGTYEVTVQWETGEDVSGYLFAHVLSAVPLDANRVLDLDVPERIIRGSVTINGRPLATDGNWGLLLENAMDVGRSATGLPLPTNCPSQSRERMTYT
jgi:hypothetical protein